jgi:methyl-accepting chemotaxis protein
VAAVYHHVGKDFISISTTLPDEDGEPSLHTKIEKSNPAYDALIHDKAFIGKVKLFGKKYCVKYAPYFTDNCHGVVLALFVGVPI